LDKKYQTLEIQKKLEEVTRSMLLYRFGVLKWFWNDVTDDVDVTYVDPRLILIPKLRCNPHDLPYKIELQEYTPEEIDSYFPEVDTDKLEKENRTLNTGKSSVESKKTFKVFEVWTSDMVAWYSNGHILDKKVNPYFDFEGTDGKFNNFLEDPRDPFVFFSTYNVGDESIGSTSLVEESIPTQDIINIQKRMIVDNLVRMGNGEVIMGSDVMSREEAEGITNEIGQIVMGEGIASQGRFRRDPGLPIPSAHFSNLQDSKLAFDTIFGVNSATRGSGQSKTLGQDILNRQQDLTRIDLITRVLNRGVQRLAEGLVQLMKMNYTETHTMRIIGEEDSVEFIALNSNEIEENVEINVRTGRSPEQDKSSMATQAVQLFQIGALDPVTLFERLEFPDPEQSAQRLLMWKQGQLTMETKAKIQELAAGAGVKAANEPKEKQRGTESAQNVIQRSKESLGGKAPTPGKQG